MKSSSMMGKKRPRDSTTKPLLSSSTSANKKSQSSRGQTTLMTTKDVLRGKSSQGNRSSRLDEEIGYSESDSDNDNNEGYYNTNDNIPLSKEEIEENQETIDAKRVRLAKEYLSQIAKSVQSKNKHSVDHLDTTVGGIQEEFDNEEDNNIDIHDQISYQLQSTYLLTKGYIIHNIADKLKLLIYEKDNLIRCTHPQADGIHIHEEYYTSTNDKSLQSIQDTNNANTTSTTSSSSSTPSISAPIHIYSRRGHELPITALAVTSDGTQFYTASKGCDIIQWSINYNKDICTKSLTFPGRRRTKQDVEKQIALAASGKKGILPVFGSSYGGGRIGTTSNTDSSSSSSNSNTTTMNESESMMKIVQHHGQTSQDHSSSITMLHPSSKKLSQKAIAIARARGVPDYQIIGHWDEILCLDISPDNHYLASGGRDNTVRLWDIYNYNKQEQIQKVASEISQHTVSKNTTTSSTSSSSSKNTTKSIIKPTETFVGHKDAVTAVVFRPSTGSASTITTTSQGTSSTTRTSTTTSTLYSASYDRMIKIWSIDARAHLDTLFGHQDSILDLTVPSPITNSKENISKERCFTVGKDNTARVWKIAEQSQLLFRGHNDTLSLEVIRSIGDGTLFITGGQDGGLCLWSVHRKRPIYTVPYAHGNGLNIPQRDQYRDKVNNRVTIAEDADGFGPPKGLREQMSLITGCHPDHLSSGYCSWITAISVLPNSNVIVTGSGDGYLRFWKLVSSTDTDNNNTKTNKNTITNPWNNIQGLQYIGGIPMKGIITGIEWSMYNNPVLHTVTNEENSLSSSSSSTALYLIITISQEHRLGRWWNYKGVKNNVVIMKITL